jgi:hypothetical protein
MTLRSMAESGEATVGFFAEREGLGGDPLESQLTDLLIDLRHLAAGRGIDFLEALARSERYFRAERDGIPATADPADY